MKNLVVFFSLLISIHIIGQNVESDVSKFTTYIHALDNFSRNIPQEKVYLHFDNTSYYQGDHIWFKCYIVTPGPNQLSQMSKTLYVELLNPGGEIIDKRILKIEKGQCHGEFSLNHLPFYSGFYEVRAYTKYMLNFRDDIIFSRLLPVFNRPKTEGNFKEREMMSYGRWGTGLFPMKRKPPLKEKAVNLRFFPEGGNLIQGVTSRVAFEVTDEAGNPIDVTGVVKQWTIDNGQLTVREEEIKIATLHEGKGVFACMPSGGRRNDVVEVEYSGKKYQFDLPACLSHGVVMEVDNLSDSDSIRIILRKSINTPAQILGLAVLNGGKLLNHHFAYIRDKELRFAMDKTGFPSGVSQIVLFNSNGEIVCDRLIFTDTKTDRLDILTKTDKSLYRPYELIEMECSIADKEVNPVKAAFSLSVRDGANMVENNHTVLTDLLLMSEIKGYVRNPFYYFEEGDDNMRRAALDALLMVQGWRRYSWNQMAGIDPFELKYFAEQGIEIDGKIVSMVKKTPQPNVDVGLFLLQRGEEDMDGASAIEKFVTDEQGHFAFVSDVQGKWNMILTVSEKGKKKDHRILIDKPSIPEPRRYNYSDLQIDSVEKPIENLIDEVLPEQFEAYDLESFLVAYEDSLSKLGISEKINRLDEVTVTARRRTREQDIFHNRSTSVAYYDVASEMDDIYDSGKYIGDDIHQILMNMNKDFMLRNEILTEYQFYEKYEFLYKSGITPSDKLVKNYELLQYKNKLTLFVVDYEPVRWSFEGYFKYKPIRLSGIKSIYINEDIFSIAQYIISLNPFFSSDEIVFKYLSCVVFIETYPDGEIPVEDAKGVRKTWLEGYSTVKEFYHPDYSVLPPESDYRRTLYWNPNVTTDEHGKATVRFYNNSSCKNFNISAETVTPLGMIGVYRKEK